MNNGPLLFIFAIKVRPGGKRTYNFSCRTATNNFVFALIPYIPKECIMEERLVELETKTAFLEKTLEELNEVVVNQQQQIDMLTKNLDRVQEQLLLITSSLPDEALMRE